ncbi:polysaccharide deacetylase family protein [Hahella ganghwensis]|uniref:polysaccharide deacetylase family protein n=1 Tax=Hahella ganghwensis TaxID=286420 RepID=UPI0003660001|nr:polysaccharide deacetylase family protein [Hahella ganghwensis]
MYQQYNTGTAVAWPQGYRAAGMISVDVDTVTPMLWRERHSSSLSPAEVEQRLFGIRQGVPRILSMLQETNLQAVFFVPSAVAELNPQMIRDIVSEGHEIGVHGYIHETLSEISSAESQEILNRSLQTLTELSGQKPVGYRSPSWNMSSYLPGQLRQLGIRYDSSLMGYEQPYKVEELLELPVSWYLDDAPHFIYLGDGNDPHAPKDSQAVFEGWRRAVNGVKHYGGYFSITVHPWIVGRMERCRDFAEFLSWLANDPELWIQKGGDLAEYLDELRLPSTTLVETHAQILPAFK